MRFPRFRPLAQRLGAIGRRALPRRLRLDHKLTLIVVAIACLNVAISVFLLLPQQRQECIGDTELVAVQMSDVVEARLQHVMLVHSRQPLPQTLQAELGNTAPTAIWILDARGTARYATVAGDLGRRFAYAEPGCRTCHEEGYAAESWADVLRMSAGDEGLLNIRLIRNQPECHSCHDADQSLLGFVVVALPLTELQTELRSGLGRLAISALVTFVLLVGLLRLALRRFVTAPIGELVAGMAALQGGNLDHRVQVRSGDELGELGRAFEAMRREIKRTRWETRRLGILEERDRLARELHDNLAQQLAYLNLKACSAHELLANGEVQQATASLDEFKVTARDTYVDVREAIFNLRTARSPEHGLLGTLQEYLAEYRLHYGVDVHLLLDGQDPNQLSPDTSIQLLRIIQEALMNVRKHAGTSRAAVSFVKRDGCMHVLIEDDGRGFDREQQLAAEGCQHCGLQIMQERAESASGSVTVTSRPGAGTRVDVRLPLPQE